VDVHRQVVQLSQTVHALEQHDNQTSALDRLYRSREDVGRDGFEVLQDAYAKGVSQNLLRLFVVGVSDVVEGDEELERILGVCFSDASLDFLFDFLLALLAVTAPMLAKACQRLPAEPPTS
jgi:hypothetical protein